MLGGGRDWELRRRRNQYTGALSYFKDNFAGGSHNLKFGGEYLDEEGTTLWNQAYADNVIHFVRGDLTGPLTATTADQVRLYNNAVSISALATTSLFVTDTWTVNRLTMNIGARFDRYRVWLPEQSFTAGRFVPTATALPEQSSIVTFNHIVPRIGASYDITGDGKTVVKANYGRFYFNPGVNLADAVNENTANQYSDHLWNDLNNDRIFQDGEQGALQTRFGGVANAFIDPDLENAFTDEASVFVERSVMTDLGVRAGFVWKKDKNGWQQFNTLRPFSAYNVPVSVIDPGPDGVTGNGDDSSVAAFNLDPSLLTASRQEAINIDGYEGTYKTLEFSTNKRFSNRWGLNASYWYTWTREFGNNYFNNRFAHRPVELLVLRQLSDQPEREDRQRVRRLERQAQRHGRRRLGHQRDPGVEDPERRALRPLHQRHAQLRHADHPGRADWHPPSGHRVGVRLPRRKAAAVCDQGPLRAVRRRVQRLQLEHGPEHQLALRRVVREGDDGARAAHRQVRRQVRLVGADARTL